MAVLSTITQASSLPAAVYHMTHISNLLPIFSYGLQAHNTPHKQIDISNQHVNAYRARIVEPVYHRSLHSYVPFYFNPTNAMLYKIQKEYADNIVILQFDSTLLCQDNTLFTSRNAVLSNATFSNDLNKLETLNWDLIFSRSWNGCGEHVKQIMMSEVLVFKQQSLDMLATIHCQNQSVTDMLNSRFSSTLFSHQPELFF